MNSIDAVVAAIARRQHSLITRRQALGVGLTSSSIHRRCASGRWTVIQRGVFHLNGAPVTWRTMVMAACLATGGCASHRTAAALMSLRGFLEGRIEITVRAGHRNDAVDAIQHERDDFDLIVPTAIDGIPTTPPDRLVADLGMSVPYERYEKAVLHMVGGRLIAWDDVVRSRLRHSRRGRNGCGALSRLLVCRAGSEVPESVLEQSLLFLLQEAGIDALFEQQVEVLDHQGRFVMRADFGIVRAKLLIECDSLEHHLYDPAAFEADRRKRNEAELLGWKVLAFTWKQVVSEPRKVIQVIQRALRQCGV